VSGRGLFPLSSLALRAAVSLGAMPALASGLRAVAAAHDVAPLLRYLLPHLVRAALSGSGEDRRDGGVTEA